MSTDNANKESYWRSFLRIFCCMHAASSSKEVTEEESAPSTGSQSDPDLRTVVEEKPKRASVIYNEPPQQLRPSTAPESGSASPSQTLDLADKMAEWELVSFPVPESPAIVKKGHRRWSSALHLMTFEHEKRFTSRGFHFPRKRVSKIKSRPPSAIQGNDSRPRASSSPDETARHKAEIAKITMAAMLREDSDSTVQGEEEACDASPSVLARPIRDTPPRPHTPPFPPPRVSMIPLPPPLPATMRSATKKRKSLTQVSNWLSRSTEPVPQVPDMVTIKDMINQCFSQADPHCRRFSDGSITTVNTWNTEDSLTILSAWSRNSMEVTKAEEFLYPRKFSAGAIKRPSPLANNVGVAV